MAVAGANKPCRWYQAEGGRLVERPGSKVSTKTMTDVGEIIECLLRGEKVPISTVFPTIYQVQAEWQEKVWGEQ